MDLSQVMEILKQYNSMWKELPTAGTEKEYYACRKNISELIRGKAKNSVESELSKIFGNPNIEEILYSVCVRNYIANLVSDNVDINKEWNEMDVDEVVEQLITDGVADEISKAVVKSAKAQTERGNDYWRKLPTQGKQENLEQIKQNFKQMLYMQVKGIKNLREACKISGGIYRNNRWI